jgi:hypothetical protein
MLKISKSRAPLTVATSPPIHIPCLIMRTRSAHTTLVHSLLSIQCFPNSMPPASKPSSLPMTPTSFLRKHTLPPPQYPTNSPSSGSSSGYNGIDIYGSTYKSSDNFYSSTTAKAQYDARLKSILEYESPSFGKQWKDLSEVILAFDIQNEPMIASPGKLADNDPDDWLCGRAGNMKAVLGDSVCLPYPDLLSYHYSTFKRSQAERWGFEGSQNRHRRNRRFRILLRP